MSAVLAPGFAEPVFDAQRTFRAAMDALARPGRLVPLISHLEPPAPLTAELAAIALALADADAPIWLSPSLEAEPEVGRYLRFHTGAPIVADPMDAVFALVRNAAECPPFVRFALGSPEYPDRSTTLVLGVAELASEAGFGLAGPGVKGGMRLHAAPLPADFTAQSRANRQLFPPGVDLLLVASGFVAGLPRSTELTES